MQADLFCKAATRLSIYGSLAAEAECAGSSAIGQAASVRARDEGLGNFLSNIRRKLKGLVAAVEALELLPLIVFSPQVHREIGISRLDVLPDFGPILAYGFHGVVCGVRPAKPVRML